jgi:hypothetical protein
MPVACGDGFRPPMLMEVLEALACIAEIDRKSRQPVSPWTPADWLSLSKLRLSGETGDATSYCNPNRKKR